MTFVCTHPAGIATASAAVVASHNTTLEIAAANRTPSKLLRDPLQVGSLS
jgi:hypothetical protein